MAIPIHQQRSEADPNPAGGPLLVEASFADALAIIIDAKELPEDRRRHWSSSLRHVARALGRPLELIPARYGAIRFDLAKLHHVPAGTTPKTLQNHKSNTKRALLWLAGEKGVPRHGAPLMPFWEELRARITDRGVRWRLSPLMRYCSGIGVTPGDLDDAVVDDFISYRSRTGRTPSNAFRRELARAWNVGVGVIPGWPACRLIAPPVKTSVNIPWEQFPEGLRRDIDRYLESLSNRRRSQSGRRIRPLKPGTLRMRRWELWAASRMAVKTGVPIKSLNSLSDLLAPDTAEKILDAYWRRNGDTPKAFTVTLAYRLAAIANETQCLDQAGRQRLQEMWQALEDCRCAGLTDKNMHIIRQVRTPGVWARVVKLPLDMMAAARSQQSQSPVKAGVTAQLAVAIAILSAAPVRLANLAAIKLGFNLIKPDGPRSEYWLIFPDFDVKNRVRLEFPLEPYLTRLIDEYIGDFRPALLRGRNVEWLFPGQGQQAKGRTLSKQITPRIFKATGLRITVHQFRHAAGALILQRRPGEYELVRRLLGHRNIQTTINAYVGLENVQASEIFGKIVMEHMNDQFREAE
jgi:integrase